MAINKPIRSVLMTADPVGGVWTYALELGRSLGVHGVRIALATMGRMLTESEKAAVRDIPDIELFESGYRLEWMRASEPDVEASGAWLLELESRFRPDIIHLNGYSHGALPWQAPCLVVGHSCVYSWFQAVKQGTAPDEWQPYRLAVTRGLRGADLVTAPSHAMLSALRFHYGTFAATDPIYNGRSCCLFPARDKEPFVMAAGRVWDEAKNMALLDGAAQGLPWPVYVAGEQGSPDGFTSHFNNVISLGWCDPRSLADWFSRAGIYVLPARYEPFGFTVLEAALAGCALVLGDIASFRELWSGAALLVSPEDSGGLRAALLRLIEDAALRRVLAAKARQRALALTPERMARGYMRVYEKLRLDRIAATQQRLLRPEI